MLKRQVVLNEIDIAIEVFKHFNDIPEEYAIAISESFKRKINEIDIEEDVVIEINDKIVNGNYEIYLVATYDNKTVRHGMTLKI